MSIVLIVLTVGFLLIRTPDSIAYLEYADIGFGGCDNCHGAFQDNRSYFSLVDGTDWNADLMDSHNFMVSDDCNICHEQGQNFPVFLNTSDGGLGLDPISCVGCHGRAKDRGIALDCVDPNNPNPPCGDGAGLRQHHYNASPNFAGLFCLSCHADTDPANFTPVLESVKPPYYKPAPDSNYPDKPTDPCNANDDENFDGTTIGLDNDGDNAYDVTDPDCNDTDDDGVLDDGDSSGMVGDNHCAGGNIDNCDDNCIDTPNTDQADADNDGMGDVCDVCPNRAPARIKGTTPVYYATIWEAYANAAYNETIQCQDIIYDGDFDINDTKPMKFEGGYNCDYSSVIGSTRITGNITVSDGVITIEDGVLEVQ